MIFATTFVVMLVWTALNGDERRKRIAKGAGQVRGQLRAFYSPRHVLDPFELAEYPQLDAGFYERVCGEFGALGYRFLHDVEDKTMSDATGMLNCYRVMSDGHGTTRVAGAHMRVNGWQRWVAPLFGVPRDIFAVEFLSELEDGSFLMTNNIAGVPAGMPLPDTWACEKFPLDTPWDALHARHRDRLRAAASPPLRLFREEDVLASYDRQWQSASDWWHARGGSMSRDEWRTLTGTESRLSEDLYEELTVPGASERSDARTL